jgi:hypothetical protein
VTKLTWVIRMLVKQFIVNIDGFLIVAFIVLVCHFLIHLLLLCRKKLCMISKLCVHIFLDKVISIFLFLYQFVIIAVDYQYKYCFYSKSSIYFRKYYKHLHQLRMFYAIQVFQLFYQELLKTRGILHFLEQAWIHSILF